MTYSGRQLHYLKTMGIPAWELRSAPVQKRQALAPEAPITGLEFEFTAWLVAQPLQLLTGTASPAFALGPDKARLLVVSDCSEEQKTVQPFYAQAGKMLDAMLRAIGHSRTTCQIAALDRNESIETLNLLKFAQKNQPKVILFMTNPHASANKAPIDTVNDASSMTVHSLPKLPNTRCITSYHPDYLLSHPADKRQAWEHLKCVARLLGSAVNA